MCAKVAGRTRKRSVRWVSVSFGTCDVPRAFSFEEVPSLERGKERPEDCALCSDRSWLSWMQLIGVGDCWPDTVKCAKGDHTVRVQVRERRLGLKRIYRLENGDGGGD